MKRDWEDIWGTVLQVYLGICILGWVLGNYSEYNRNA